MPSEIDGSHLSTIDGKGLWNLDSNGLKEFSISDALSPFFTTLIAQTPLPSASLTTLTYQNGTLYSMNSGYSLLGAGMNNRVAVSSLKERSME